ncbi:MAG: (2E,6E)-farnesyl diphosphate synthase [Gammaproteobacteria bacterium]|nr:MAG: (2E,6E)-farnesyl diphosphate synthase [Gammaproteobacteria bacterium]
MEQARLRVEQALERRLPSAATPPSRLHEAMRYATLGNGKRLRPVLCYATGQLLGAPLARLDAPACAVELIHAYSLVHDDLPAMDDDALRRGRPTCHCAFDEATAILAGDALQSLAFRLLAHDPALDIPAERRLRMVDELTHAAGSRGMAGGQAMDIEAVGHELSLAELENMHIHKTGALIRASVRLGALGTDQVTEESLRALDHYAKCIGLAFQIRDDILDVEGETEAIGKTQGKDAANDKPTYPALVGLDEARAMARGLLEDALASLAPFGDDATHLRELALYVIDRKR